MILANDLEFDCNSTVYASLAAVTANGSADYSQKIILGGGSGNSLALSANQPLKFRIKHKTNTG